MRLPRLSRGLQGLEAVGPVRQRRTRRYHRLAQHCEFPGLLHVAHDAIPERFGRSAEPGDAEQSPDDEEVSDSTDSEGVAIPPPFELAVPPSDSDPSSSSSQSSSTVSPTPSPPRTPPRTPPPREEWPALSPQAPRLPTRVAPWPQRQGTVPVVAPRAPPAPRPAAQRPAPVTPAPAPNAAATGLRGSARSNAGIAPAANWFDATAQLKGKVKGVPVASYCEHGVPRAAHALGVPCAPISSPHTCGSGDVLRPSAERARVRAQLPSRA
jgi:hypothetical protein